MIRRLAALLLFFVSIPAFAQSGTVTLGGGWATFSLPIPAGPGNYRLDFTFDTPVAADVTINSQQYFNFYFVDSGQYIGGDEVPYSDTSYFYTPTTQGSVLWSILPPYTSVSGDIREEGYYKGLGVIFNLYAPDDVTVAYTVNITAVPEPAQWALLIGGFGAAGALLRRRARRPQMA